MSLRFRQSLRVFPGVHLNIGKTGISATIGVRGASINVGRHGLRTTVGLPGSGLSFTDNRKWGGSAKNSPSPAPAPAAVPEAVAPNWWMPGPAPAIEHRRDILSAGIDGLTGPGMMELRAMLVAARDQATTIARQLSAACSTANDLASEQSRKQRAILKFLHKGRLAELADAVPAAAAEVAELTSWRDTTHVDIEFQTTGEIGARYDALSSSFEPLSRSAAIWDLVADVRRDRVKARSFAATAIERKPVRFTRGTNDLIRFDGTAMRLGNANGPDIAIYPGLIVVEAVDQRFALIEIRDVELQFVTVTFSEAESVPVDAEVVGYTWMKVNKDGSRDKRFADNRQIPLIKYALLHFTSATGLNEQYMVSNFPAGEAFSTAYNSYRTQFLG